MPCSALLAAQALLMQRRAVHQQQRLTSGLPISTDHDGRALLSPRSQPNKIK